MFPDNGYITYKIIDPILLPNTSSQLYSSSYHLNFPFDCGGGWPAFFVPLLPSGLVPWAFSARNNHLGFSPTSNKCECDESTLWSRFYLTYWKRGTGVRYDRGRTSSSNVLRICQGTIRKKIRGLWDCSKERRDENRWSLHRFFPAKKSSRRDLY